MALGLALVLAPVAARADDDEPDAADRWPLAYVLRPQTLLRGMLEIDLSAQAFRPNDFVNVDPTTGNVYEFNSNLNIGTSIEGGITDRLGAGISLPRLLCFDSGQPSGCSPYNRFRGSAGVDYGILRRALVQTEVGAGSYVAHSSPSVFGWYADFELKLLAVSRVSVSVDFTAERAIDPPSTLPGSVLYAYLNGGLDVQVTERFLVLAHLEPWAPLSHLDEGVALEVYGGLSYTFNHRVQAACSAGVYNALSAPLWYASVPGTFATVSLAFWQY